MARGWRRWSNSTSPSGVVVRAPLQQWVSGLKVAWQASRGEATPRPEREAAVSRGNAGGMDMRMGRSLSPPAPPRVVQSNKGVELTAYSVRSYLASASSRRSRLAFGSRYTLAGHVPS
jgi:hypothetical protein